MTQGIIHKVVVPKKHSISVLMWLAMILMWPSAQWLEPLWPGETDEKSTASVISELKKRLQALEQELKQIKTGESADAPKESLKEPSEKNRPEISENPPPEKPEEIQVKSFFKREPLKKPAPLRGVYDKPFLVEAWRRAYFGGYTEFDFHSFRDDPLEIPKGFRALRTNLFAFSEISDRLRFGAELEFENEEPGEELEVKTEMAFVEWALFEEFRIRGGALLAPLGRVNINHDGPIRELTDRPLVSRFVIPTTLTEVGIGPTGTVWVFDQLSLSYEIYVVNGFNLLDRDGEIAVPITEREHLLREGRPSLGGDINANIATTGRVSIQALNALDAGFSWHLGDYDELNDNTLSILAGDLALVYGPFALEGELAWAGFERDAFARTAGIPDRYWGYYVQASASHMPKFLKDHVPYVFEEEGSAFTAVLRYDWVDLDGDHAEALEPGINFRPFSDTVFKFSYRFGFKGLGVRNVPGRNLDDDGFVFSLASYF